MALSGPFREFSSQLVREVKKRPVLYDRSVKGYNDQSVVSYAWGEIGEILGIDHDLARKRWQNLRSSYTRATSANHVFYLGDDMSFLENHLMNVKHKANAAANSNKVASSAANPGLSPDMKTIEQNLEEEEHSDSDSSIPLMSPSLSPRSLPYSNSTDRDDFEQQKAKRPKKSIVSSTGNSSEVVDAGWQKAAKAFFMSQLTNSACSSPSTSSLRAEPRDPDLDFLKGLLPQIQQLKKRTKRLYFQKISNLLFSMLDEQDEDQLQLVEENEVKPVV